MKAKVKKEKNETPHSTETVVDILNTKTEGVCW